MAVCEDRVVAACNELRQVDSAYQPYVLDDGFPASLASSPRSPSSLPSTTTPYIKTACFLTVVCESLTVALQAPTLVGGFKMSRRSEPAQLPACERKETDLFPAQDLFFSHYSYQALEPVFPDMGYRGSVSRLANARLAIRFSPCRHRQSKPFVLKLKSFEAKVKSMCPRPFTIILKRISTTYSPPYKSSKGAQRIIVTTEKYAVRLASNPYFPHEIEGIPHIILPSRWNLMLSARGSPT